MAAKTFKMTTAGKAELEAELEKLKQQSDNTEEYLRVLNKRLDNSNIC